MSEQGATNLADRYKSPLIEWDRITAGLDAGFPQAPGTGGPDRHTCWLATVNADGTPHLTGVGAQWVDGAFWLETGASTRKGKNIDRDPRCSLSVSLHDFDLIIDGRAEMVTEPATVAAMAKRWAAGGWPCTVDATGTALTAEWSAPSAGPPPWHIYRIAVTAATAVLTVEPGGATKWAFVT